MSRCHPQCPSTLDWANTQQHYHYKYIYSEDYDTAFIPSCCFFPDLDNWSSRKMIMQGNAEKPGREPQSEIEKPRCGRDGLWTSQIVTGGADVPKETGWWFNFFFVFLWFSERKRKSQCMFYLGKSCKKNNKNVCYLFHWIKSKCRLYTAKMTLQDEKRENSGRQLNGEDKAASLQVADRLQRPWGWLSYFVLEI